MKLHLATNPAGRPLIKMDMHRAKRTSTGGTLNDSVKIDSNNVGMSNARGATAAVSPAQGGTVPPDQTFYSLRGGRDYISYDNQVASNQTVPAASWVDYVQGVQASQVKKITVSLNNPTTTTKMRFIVRVGTSWYATSAQFSCANAHSDPAAWSTAELAEFTMTRAASAWRDLTTNPGSALALGAVRSVKLPAGEVTGYGVFADEGVGSFGALRFTDLNLCV